MEPRGVTAEIRERITSGVERARDAVRAVTAAVRERLPGASEREVAQASGDYFVDATERDVAEAGGDAALSPAVREHVVEADILPAELAGIAEQRQGVPLEDNAIAQLEAGHADLVTAGIETMAAEDPETAAEVAVLVDEASALPAPADAGRSHEGGAEHGELARLSEIFERQYRQELAGGFDELVTTGLSDAERQFIASSEEVRAKIEAARASFAGEPIPAVEYVGSPEVMRQSAALFEIARRVDEPFQAEMQDVAATVHAEYVRGEPKSIGRIAEKTEKENKNDISLLKDAVRCRFILVGDPTTDDVPVIEEVRRRYSIAQDETTGKEKIKRKYIAEDGTPLSIAGQSQYMDTKITVKVPDAVTGTDIFGEVVIATPEMAAATVAEHPLYEIIRSLNGTSSAEVTLRLKLETLSETFYESVSEQLGSTLQPGRNGES